MAIEANELRKLAETADGIRNQDLVLIKRGGVLMVVPTGDVQMGDDEVIELRTDDEFSRDERPDFEIELQVEDGPDVPLSADYDAVFWSLAAVDKFVIPYYARIWPIEKVNALRVKIAADAAFISAPHPPGSTLLVNRFTVAGGFQTLTVEDYLLLDVSQAQQQ